MGKLEIVGMRELQKSIKQLGEVPQKCVTSAAKKGMQIVLKSAKNNAPVDTGALKTGIKLLGEKSTHKGKKVYRLVFDKAKNNIFQKRNAKGEIIGYYPVSQEYGYFSKNGRYIPGFHFAEKGLAINKSVVEQKIVNEMSKNIDKALKG